MSRRAICQQRLALVFCITVASLASAQRMPDNLDGDHIFQRNAAINEEIIDAVAKHRNIAPVPPELMFALFWQESHYDPNATTTKSTACGLGQIITSMAHKVGLVDCKDIKQNVDASTMIVASELKHYSSSMFRSLDKYQLTVASYYQGDACVSYSLHSQTCNFIDNKIVVSDCHKQTWVECLSKDAQTYLHMVYYEYRPLAIVFVDWRRLQESVGQKEALVSDIKAKLEVSGLPIEVEGSTSSTNRSSSAESLKDARDSLQKTETEEERAHQSFVAKYNQINNQYGALQHAHSVLLEQANMPIGTYLLERDAEYDQPIVVVNGAVMGVCARWTLFVNDHVTFHVQDVDRVVQRPLPPNLEGYVSKTRHGSYVIMRFSLNSDYSPTNLQVIQEIGEGYAAYAQQILAMYKVLPFSPDQVRVAKQFAVSGCNPASPREVRVVFGRELNPDGYQQEEVEEGWKRVVDALGVFKEPLYLSFDTSEKINGVLVYSSHLSWARGDDALAGHLHLCRIDATDTRWGPSTVIWRGKDLYRIENGKITQQSEVNAGPECGSESIVQSLIGRFGVVIAVGECTLTIAATPDNYECFVQMGRSYRTGTPMVTGIVAVNHDSDFPAANLLGFDLNLVFKSSDYRKISGAYIPYHTERDEMSDNSSYEFDISDVVIDVPINDSMFDAAKVASATPAP
jgi:Transglycosylase SLT domain